MEGGCGPSADLRAIDCVRAARILLLPSNFTSRAADCPHSGRGQPTSAGEPTSLLPRPPGVNLICHLGKKGSRLVWIRRLTKLSFLKHLLKAIKTPTENIPITEEEHF